MSSLAFSIFPTSSLTLSSTFLRRCLRHSTGLCLTRPYTSTAPALNPTTKACAAASTSPSSGPPSSATLPDTSSSSSPTATDVSSAATSALRPLRKGDSIDVTITHIGYGGVCVGRLSALTAASVAAEDADISVYVPKGACPGDLIQCQITKVRRRRNRPNNQPLAPPPDAAPDSVPPASYIEANYTALLRPSEQAVAPPPCPHFGNFRLGGAGCGGCSALHVPYDVQLMQKATQMHTLFSSLAAEHAVPIASIVACSSVLRYRNKMEFTFGRRWYTNRPERAKTQPTGDEPSEAAPAATQRRDQQQEADDYALGLHAPQRFDKIVEITDCHIHHPIGNEILSLVRARAPAHLLEPYDTRKNTGYLRNVAIRTSVTAAGRTEVMVNLITSPCDVPQRLAPLAAEVAALSPDIVCVLQNIRGVTGTHNTASELERVLWGERAYIEQALCGLTFRISANSFFQTNPEQAANLYEEVRRAARLDAARSDTVLDLFCGTGTIGLCLAAGARHIYGMDITASAIDDARVNAAANGIVNATFVQGNLDKLKDATGEWAGFANPDVIIVDPPRAGLHPDLIQYLAKCQAKRIVYVSCNPISQVQDVRRLMELAPGTWEMQSIQPVDMFPNTHHVECVVALERSTSKEEVCE